MFRWHTLTVLMITILSFSLFQPVQALGSTREDPCCQMDPQPGQPLKYERALNKWWFRGTVIEIRHIHAIGMPAQVAHIQSAGFQAWVFLSFETGIPHQPQLTLGKARLGDYVEVSIAGSHVLPNQINWDLCEPRYSLYCSYGWLYDAGPFSPDWQVMLSPSNEFIHYGDPNISWEQGLYWNTEKINDANHNHKPGTPRFTGSKPARAGGHIPADEAPGANATGIHCLVASDNSGRHPGLQSTWSGHLAEQSQSRAGRSTAKPDGDGDRLAGIPVARIYEPVC